MLLDAQAGYTLLAEVLEIGGTVGDAHHPFVEPGIKALPRARVRVVVVAEGVVAVAVALHRRGVRAPGFMHNGAHLEGWANDAVGVADDHRARDDLFYHDN